MDIAYANRNHPIGAILSIFVLIALAQPTSARDNGQYAQQSPEIRNWFKGLHTQTGVSCCDTADGTRVEDPDWRINPNGTYSVRLDGEWQVVAADAVILDKNRVGYTIVWTYFQDGKRMVRCLMPGGGV